jgi:hypothetical protein
VSKRETDTPTNTDIKDRMEGHSRHAMLRGLERQMKKCEGVTDVEPGLLG